MVDHQAPTPPVAHPTTPPLRPPGRYFEPAPFDEVVCLVCPNRCHLAPNRTGQCGVRTNKGGAMALETWGRVATLEAALSDALPLYHYHPEMKWLVVGQRGCVMRCPFCNTARYSQLGAAPQRAYAPEDLVAQATAHHCAGVSFGINDPVPAVEFVLATLASARQSGMHTHLATAGYVEEAPLRDLCRVAGAMTFGLKGTEAASYDRVTGGELRAVMQATRVAAALGVHLELSYVLLPGQNDTAEDAARLARWVLELEPAPPVLLLPFEPAYAWAHSAPCSAALLDAFQARLADHGVLAYTLHPDASHRDTRCCGCQRTIVRREGNHRPYVSLNADGTCPQCGTPAPFRAMQLR